MINKIIEAQYQLDIALPFAHINSTKKENNSMFSTTKKLLIPLQTDFRHHVALD